jgi:DNA-binding MarR family transcriptional regulator/ribosomal protein S18 acetylase RimI-like enzyme
MDREAVATLRRFHRTVTERVGALDTSYLGRGRTLGESRLLWEIGVDGCDVRELRRRLALDSGYTSRLLRTLEAQGLVRVEPSERDRRVRVARLTRRGERERAELDRRSDELATEILAPLDERQREQLIDAAAKVERLLTASHVTIAVEDPRSRDGRWCIAQYFAELARRFDGGFDPARTTPAEEKELSLPRGVLLVARLHAQPVGCGVVKGLRSGGPAEIKRLWVAPEARGLGLGRRLLQELELRATAAGAHTVRLDTNRSLTEAIALYRSSGYREIARFNDEPYAHHWFEKNLRAPRTSRA